MKNLNYTPIIIDTFQTSGSSISKELYLIRKKIESNSDLPPELKDKLCRMAERAEISFKFGLNITQIDSIIKYIDCILSLPWRKETKDILDLQRAKEYMERTHFGLQSAKKRLLEYLSVLILQRKNKESAKEHSPVLFFVGLAGTGKTTFARTVAETLGRKFYRIPFGGLASPFDLRGLSKVNPEAEPGMIIKALQKTGSKNCVILLDELDRVSPEVRGAIMGVLLEILDPEQNSHFVDHYIDFPFDLSKVIFVAAANNTQNIATAVLDRMEIIQMPSYTDEEKVVIARDYILPKLLASSGISKEAIVVEDEVWKHLARLSGYDPGIRSVERKVEEIVRKVAFKIVNNMGSSFSISLSNIKEYIE